MPTLPTMSTAIIGTNSSSSGLAQKDWKSAIERLRTMARDFMQRIKADDYIDFSDHFKDFRRRLDKLDDDFGLQKNDTGSVDTIGTGNAVDTCNAQMDNSSSGGLLQDDVAGPLQDDVEERMAFAKLYMLIGLYMRKTQPPGSDSLDMAAARGMLRMVHTKMDELNKSYPTFLKMPGKDCSQGTLGTTALIDLDYIPLKILQCTLRAKLEHGTRMMREDRVKLNNEWEHRVTRAIRSLRARLTCPTCDYIHHSPAITEMIRHLNKEMLDYDTEEITEKEIRDWKDRMQEIEEDYIRETGMKPPHDHQGALESDIALAAEHGSGVTKMAQAQDIQQGPG